MRLETACEEAEVSSERDGERERHLKKELFKIQQQEERTYSKSSKRERGLIQNPAREREDLFKIQQERERGLIQNPARERRQRERARVRVVRDSLRAINCARAVFLKR